MENLHKTRILTVGRRMSTAAIFPPSSICLERSSFSLALTESSTQGEATFSHEQKAREGKRGWEAWVTLSEIT